MKYYYFTFIHIIIVTYCFKLIFKLHIIIVLCGSEIYFLLPPPPNLIFELDYIINNMNYFQI